jgi:hypothetical protein
MHDTDRVVGKISDIHEIFMNYAIFRAVESSGGLLSIDETSGVRA